jgi:hypothetical protein
VFCACPSNKHCPSVRCAYAVNVVHLEPFLLIAFMLLFVDRIYYHYNYYAVIYFVNFDLYCYYFYHHYYYIIGITNLIELLLL